MTSAEPSPARAPARRGVARVAAISALLILLALALAASVPLGHDHAAMRTWAAASLAITLCPLAIWALGSGRRAGRSPSATGAPAVIDLRDGADRPSDAGTATAVATSVSAAQKTTLISSSSSPSQNQEKTP